MSNAQTLPDIAEVRKSVIYRFSTGQADVLSAVTGVPMHVLVKFAKTGEIEDMYANILRASA